MSQLAASSNLVFTRLAASSKTLHESAVIAKFIKEAFHIENEYLMQLSPSKYQTTPQFIINECDRLLGI